MRRWPGSASAARAMIQKLALESLSRSQSSDRRQETGGPKDVEVADVASFAAHHCPARKRLNVAVSIAMVDDRDHTIPR